MRVTLSRTYAELMAPRPSGAPRKWVVAIWVSLAIIMAIFLGQIATVFGSLFGQKPIVLVALPLILLFALFFLLNRPALLYGILLTRAGLDPILEFTKLPMGESGLGIGAILNGLIILLTISMLLEKGARQIHQARMFAPFLVILLVGVMRSPLTGDAIKLHLGIMTAFSAFIIGSHFAESESSAKSTMQLVVWSSILPTLTSILMVATGFNFSTSQSFDSMDGAEGNRFSGPFTHPNIMAFYCLLVLIALLYLWRTNQLSRHAWINRLAPIYLVALIGLIALTKTRSAWGACAATFVLYGIFFERRFLVYSLIGLLASLSLPSVQERIADIFSGNEYRQYAKLNSYAWRTLLWTEALDWMPKSAYFAGLGFESFRFHTPEFFTLSNRAMIGAHNVYMELFFETGLIGLAAFFWIFMSSAMKVGHLLKNHKQMAGVGLLLIVVYVLVCYSDNMLSYLIVNLYFWLMIGGIIGTTRPIPKSKIQA